MSVPSGPSSPTLTFSEDLTRFPTESLHSFSFAQQSEDFIHNRQNVLKRSIDFMRDKLGWAASNAAIASAQAKLSGDQEVQSMMELLSRANLIGAEAAGAHGLSTLGPVTGPAHAHVENIFDKSFVQQRSESPGSIEEPTSPKSASRSMSTESSNAYQTKGEQEFDEARRSSLPSAQDSAEAAQLRQTPTQPPTRATLKRTFTDIGPISLQNQLTDALAKPYVVNDGSKVDTLISPTYLPTATMIPQVPTPHAGTAAPHGHGNRTAPAAQAIFTTDAQSPWTITAANDLACLVFGVTRAEVKKIGILEVVRPERRKWLEDRLKTPGATSTVNAAEPSTQAQRTTGNTSSTSKSAFGNGVTARLLSKPSSRAAGKRRSQTDDGSGSSMNRKPAKGNHNQNKSRGVLLCGDVVPIQKRNGAMGSASLWVKEKRGGLIWVLEEIAEDVVYVSVDEVGCVFRGEGAIESLWGSERLRRGMDLARLIPSIPRRKGTNTGALDYDQIARDRYFTARTSNAINIPITVEQLSGQSTFRVSSFPHIAGIIVLNPQSLTIKSSNSVFSAALFGQTHPDGQFINNLIPAFDKILRVMTDEDHIDLVDGIVIPEHSFRRARALLAMREGKGDAAAIFLRPSGLPARHRDGAEIMVDVQMRVVRSERAPAVYDEQAVDETPGDEAQQQVAHSPELVYALWVTYSRHLHATNHGVGPVTPLLSRPGTPPHQPSPGQTVSSLVPLEVDHDESNNTPSKFPNQPISILTQQLKQSTPNKSNAMPDINTLASPGVEMKSAMKKKNINDFVILEEMGQGAYGQVKLCRSKKSNNKVVIKYVTKRRILVDTWTRDRKLGTVPLEIHVLDYLRRDGFKHPNIVEMSDFFEDDINYYIEMVPHGLPGMDLFDYIELRVNMDEMECQKIFVQVAEALYHLHTKAKVVHRDIKDENVILDGEGNIKLIDFGSAAYIKNGPFDVFVGTIGK
jgi:protein-serine/threonine kinase